eukprot:5973051-Amphidinium_carterae.1
MEELTCLPEYRNGGLLIDAGCWGAIEKQVCTPGVSVPSSNLLNKKAWLIQLHLDVCDTLCPRRTQAEGRGVAFQGGERRLGTCDRDARAHCGAGNRRHRKEVDLLPYTRDWTIHVGVFPA